jgi:hypothetical protein
MKAIYLAIAGLGIASAVNAHHSNAIYSNEPIELEGEIASIAWQNPHIILELKTTGADGDVQTWRMEGASATGLQRAGLTREMLRVGDRVKVTGRPSRRDPRTLAGNVLLPDDRFVQNMDQVVDAQRENRGLFRVWSVPGPMLRAGAAALRNLPFSPAAVAARESFDLLDNFATRCEPEGMPRIMFNPHPFEFVDRGDTIVLRAELYDIERTIHMNSSAAPTDQRPSRLGYSVGRWNGNDLVITTTRVSWPFFDNAGTPQSSAVEIVERYSLSDDQARLTYRITVTDPATFTAPAVIDGYWLALGHSIDRYDCRVSG